jgi:large subunit ribosomal protein L3
MVPGILGKKIGMTQMFRPDGQVVPVTLLQAGPCVVVQRKTPASDGYDAIQLALVEYLKPTRMTKPAKGHLKAAELDAAKFLREFRLAPGDGDYKTGDKILAESFETKQKVDVIGTSKGRGFAGVVKRHKFGGGEGSHGSMFHRAPGSIGSSSYPSRVFKGMRMGGQMGSAQVTVRNLEIVDVNTEDNVIAIKGAIPGPKGSYVVVKRSRR